MFPMTVGSAATRAGPTGSTRGLTREARLRPESGMLYPSLRPGEWIVAAVLADRVLADLILRGSGAALRGRVLPEEHFDFRGGRSRGGERDGMRPRREGC
jgi:hypothetical protein